MKKKLTSEYKRRLRLTLIFQLNGRNKTTTINTWVVAFLRYGAGVIEWRESELKALHRKTRKIMNDHVWSASSRERCRQTLPFTKKRRKRSN